MKRFLLVAIVISLIVVGIFVFKSIINPPPCTLPAPSALTYQAFPPDSIQLNWYAVPGANSYQVLLRDSTNQSLVIDTTVLNTNLGIGDLDSASLYVARVKAVCPSGEVSTFYNELFPVTISPNLIVADEVVMRTGRISETNLGMGNCNCIPEEEGFTPIPADGLPTPSDSAIRWVYLFQLEIGDHLFQFKLAYDGGSTTVDFLINGCFTSSGITHTSSTSDLQQPPEIPFILDPDLLKDRRIIIELFHDDLLLTEINITSYPIGGNLRNIQIESSSIEISSISYTRCRQNSGSLNWDTPF